jgi:hypothetical protein
VNAAELTRLVDALTERLNSTNKALDEVRAEHKKLQQEHNDHRREAEKEIAVLKREVEELKKSQAEKEIAVLKREVEELKKSKDLWGNRVFTLVMCLVSALIGGVVTNFIKKP